MQPPFANFVCFTDPARHTRLLPAWALVHGGTETISLPQSAAEECLNVCALSVKARGGYGFYDMMESRFPTPDQISFSQGCLSKLK